MVCTSLSSVHLCFVAHTDTQSDTQTHTGAETHRPTQTHTDTHRHRQTQRERETERQSDRQTDRGRKRKRERETGRDRQGETETDRDRDRDLMQNVLCVKATNQKTHIRTHSQVAELHRARWAHVNLSRSIAHTLVDKCAIKNFISAFVFCCVCVQVFFAAPAHYALHC